MPTNCKSNFIRSTSRHPRTDNAGVGSNRPSLVRNFAIGGLVFAEIYMIFTVSAPRLHGDPIPWDALMMRMAALAVLFGPFGLALGTGVGLLVDGAVRSLRKKPSKGSDHL